MYALCNNDCGNKYEQQDCSDEDDGLKHQVGLLREMDHDPLPKDTSFPLIYGLNNRDNLMQQQSY